MDRYKRQIRLRCDRGLPIKRDTPVKPALTRRDKHRKLLFRKHYEAFPEEPEREVTNDSTVKPKSPVSANTVHPKSTFSLSTPALTETTGHKATLPAVQVTVVEAHEGDEMSGKEDEQSLAVTPESFTLSSMETDTTFSSGDTEDEDFLTSATSNNLPSPEIFRRENQDVSECILETFNFSIGEDLLGLHHHIKNSTLLDVSHAESIHMHHPPNLSTILDASTILAEKTCEISNNREAGSDAKIQNDLLKSDKALKRKTPPRLSYRRPILCKKKVSFKSPVIAETFDGKCIPASKLMTHSLNKPLQMSSPPEDLKPDAEIGSEEETLPLTMLLKRSVKTSHREPKLFDFATDKERDTLFQVMRERCVKLRSVTLFPFTAV
ncbi:uncharacterized protein LOC102081985 isoform X1 [Oreochromis niloticus]|uniref:uncharacterized protein LOC102081985 isoform X1 n=1 Tax=Oreochromis niloticus TaxID=8128 RepID=UPI00039467E2|nr:uncharacterized protein LOC102081985 isoform X1 [Oreochromis niloticus]CAI5642968.1 unnamed protein product [Mustela putorius furo]